MANTTPEGLPIVGHDSWFSHLFRFLRWMLAVLVGGAKMLGAHLFLNVPLGIAYTYANGTAGVGATLTANANAVFPTLHGVAPFAGMLVVLNAEATGSRNGYYSLTVLGSSTTAWVLTRVPGFDSAAAIQPGTLIGVRQSDSAYANLVAEYTGPVNPTVGTTALTFVLNSKRSRNMGVVPSSRLPFTVQATNTNTLTIGGITYTFVAALGAVGATTQVLIAGTAALTLVNLVNAINGDAASKGTGWQEQTVPSTLTILADAVGTALRIRGASARGGDPKPQAMAATALATTIAGGGAWTNDDLSLIGKADTDVLVSMGKLVFDAAQITAAGLAAGLIIELGFTPTVVDVQYTDSTGKLLNTITDLLIPVAGGLQFNTAGATHVVATNVMTFTAQQ